MPELKIGDKAPAFRLPADGNKEASIPAKNKQLTVLYFYPKDDTPGCTKEACGFNEALQQFKSLNAQIIGISKCSVAKHDKFKAKYGLNFTLASDEEGDVCNLYGTWIKKSMYGREYMGIDRATFLIDEQGKIAAIWRKVKVPSHVEDVRKTIIELQKKAA